MMEMQSSEYSSIVRDEWQEYNLKSEQLVRNGQPMNYQVIVKENVPVSIFTNAYKVLPNEEALKLANEVTTSMGLIPASQLDSKWRMHLDIPAVFYGKKNNIATKMTALYVTPDPIELGIGSDSDPIKMGVAVRNSIDGSAGFGACVFGFRQLCGNMSQHLQSHKMMQISTAEMSQVRNLQTQTITSASFVHRESLKTDVIKNLIESVISGADEVVKRFKQMKLDELTKSQALEIAAKYPATVSKSVDWLDYNKKSHSFTPRVQGVTAFDAFQDVTEILSHTNKLGYDAINYGLQTADKILVRQEVSQQ